MNRARTLFAGIVAAFACAASAHAADPPGSWRPAPPPEVDGPSPFRQLMSGWYLRGDISYRWNSGGTSSNNVTSESYSTSYDGTVGFGWKYRWFRADLTYDRSGPTRVNIVTTAPTNQPQFTAKVSSEAVLANAYIDLGTWANFTPYVGAGAGVVRLKSVNYVDTTDSPSDHVMGVTGPGKSQNFAWAAMAGVSYQVSNSWMIDVGYRYLAMGDVPSSEGAGTRTNAAVLKSQTASEVRIGFRYLFD